MDEVAHNTAQTHRFMENMNSDLASRIDELSIGIKKILSSDLSASMTVISRTNEQVYEVPHSARMTATAIESVGENSNMLNGLPPGILKLVRDTFRGALAEYQMEISHPSFQKPKERDSAEDTAYGTATPVFGTESSRKILTHYTNIMRYVRAIGIITIYATTTTFRDWDAHSGTSTTSTVTQTYIELFPNPDFLYLGVYSSFLQQGFATFPFSIEPKLRVYHVVDSSAPIIRACANGDLQTVRTLFKDGDASPFDRMWRETSLLDLVLFRIVLSATGGLPNVQIPKLLALFKELVSHGLDPGLVRKLDSETSGERLPFFVVSNLIEECSSNVTPYLLDLGRTILKTSVQDPLLDSNHFQASDQTEPTWIPVDMVPILLTQEDWPIALKEPSTDSIASSIETGEALLSYGVYQETIIFSFRDSIDYQDPEGELLLSILQDISLNEKLQVIGFTELIKVIDCFTGLSEDDITDSIRESRLFVGIECCIESGMNILEPPPQFYAIIRKFSAFNKQHILRSVLIDLGLDEGEIDDLFEADEYALLAYQLEYLSIPWESPWNKLCGGRTLNDETWLCYLLRLSNKISKGSSDAFLLDGQSVGEALKVLEDAVLLSAELEQREIMKIQSGASDQNDDMIYAEETEIIHRHSANLSDRACFLGSDDLDLDPEVMKGVNDGYSIPDGWFEEEEDIDEEPRDELQHLQPDTSIISNIKGNDNCLGSLGGQFEPREVQGATKEENVTGVTVTDLDNDEEFDGRLVGLAAALGAFWT